MRAGPIEAVISQTGLVVKHLWSDWYVMQSMTLKETDFKRSDVEHF